MKDQIEQFMDQLPEPVTNFVHMLGQYGYTSYFVGGVVRDYFLLGIISKDIDIELHYREKLDGELRAKQWGKLALNLANDYEIERLAYDIIRVNLGGLEVEISPPRIEVFQDDSDKEHHNFDCELYSQLPVEKSFARRDFTINAMAIKYHPKVEAEFVDPFHGREHLDQKMLHYCGGNFYQDPVRLLRAIRFYFRLGFSFSTQLENELKRMKDGKLSDYYLFSEGIKSGRFFLFLRKVGEYQELDFYQAFAGEEERLDDWYGRLLRYYSQEERGFLVLYILGIDSQIPIEQKEKFLEYFGISTKNLKSLSQLNQLSRQIQNHENFLMLEQQQICEFDTSYEFYELLKSLQTVLNRLHWPYQDKDRKVFSEICDFLSGEFQFSEDVLFTLYKVLRRSKSQDSAQALAGANIEDKKKAAYLVYSLLKENYGN